jgi:hypothetical protein
MLKAVAALALVAAASLYAGSASAFCVQNNGSVPVAVHAGGPPMPIYVKPDLMPGERDCYVPRKPDGVTVEIFDRQSRQLRCRLSVPARDATIFVDGKSCRAKLG